MTNVRYQQANPRTHVKYGGSELGLFISRELTELHGGEIGLNSEAGKGSKWLHALWSHDDQNLICF